MLPGFDAAPLKREFRRMVLKALSAPFSLVNGAMATTQSPGDNSTKLATTAYSDANAAVKIVFDTRNIALASGTQIIAGAGFTPRSVHISAIVTNTAKSSEGDSDGANHSAVGNNYNVIPGTSIYTAANAILLIQTGPDQASATVAFNSDGCVLTWTKFGSPTGTANLTFVFRR